MTDSWPCSDDFELTVTGACGAPTLRPSPGLEHYLALDLSIPAPSEPNLRLGVHLHAFYPEETSRILTRLSRSLPRCDLLITTDTLTKKDNIKAHLEDLPSSPWEGRAKVLIVPNRGRNILPLLRDGLSRFREHQLILHLHTKRTTHQDFGSDWLKELLDSLVGSPARVRALMQTFQAEPDLGLVMPQPPDLIRPFVHWGANFEVATLLVRTLWSGRKLDVQAPLVFPPGMMFWARPAALEPLAEAIVALGPLPMEPLLDDGTPLHAIERLTAHACEVAGLQWALVETASAPKAARTARGAATRQPLSVWEARPEAYLEGVAGLAKRHRVLNERLEERDRQLKAISDHRDSLEASLVERDRGLAERDMALEASRRDLMAAISDHRKSLETLLAKRDHGLAEHPATLEASRHELLTAISQHQKSLETSQKKSESALQWQLSGLQEKQQELKNQLHIMVEHLETVLTERDRGLTEHRATVEASGRELLSTISQHQKSLETSLSERESALRRQLTDLQEKQQDLKNQLHIMVEHLETLLASYSRLTNRSEQLLNHQQDQKKSLEVILNRHRDLQVTLCRWEQALANRDSAFLQSCQDLIATQRNHWQQLQAILEQGIRLEASMRDCTSIVRKLEAERLAMRLPPSWRLRQALRRAKGKLARSLRPAS